MAVTTGLPELAELLAGKSVSDRRVAGSAPDMLALDGWLTDASLLEEVLGGIFADWVIVVVDVKILVSVLFTT